MRREGSAFNGLGVVMLKELADHLTSIRFIILELIVMLIAVGTVYVATQQIKDTVAEDPFLFLKFFTTSREPLPSFIFWTASRSAVDERLWLPCCTTRLYFCAAATICFASNILCEHGFST